MSITRHKPTGRWYFQFDRFIGGQRARTNKLLPEGTTRAQALEYDRRETARLFELATGGKQPEPLIADAVLLYLREHAPGLKNKKDIEGALNLLVPHYIGRTMSELSEVAKEYIKVADVSKATVRNRLAYLRSACRWAWKTHNLGSHDPAEKMVLPTVRNARHVYLTREQVLPVFRSMGLSWSRDAARVAFYTGWRISEVLNAVPMENQNGLFLTIPDTKNSDPRIVPVHPKVEHLVRRHWPPQVTKWTASKELKKALKVHGLGHARLHDLRHSAASEMINAGVGLYTVGKVLGHRSAVSTQRYAHLAAQTLQTAVSLIGQRNAKKSHTDQEKRAA